MSESRFKQGDTVYYILSSSILKGKITDKLRPIHYVINGDIILSDDELFYTKAEANRFLLWLEESD